MSNLRGRIVEIVFQGSPYIGMSLVSVKNASKNVADKILNLKVKVKCPYCTKGTPTNERRWFTENCPHCNTGYITKTLKEMVEK